MTPFERAVSSTICTPEQRAAVLKGIRDGMSLTGAARLAGRSRAWLTAARKADPAFEEEVAMALGELEQRYSQNIHDAMHSGEGGDGSPAMVSALVKLRSNRFPNLHGEDPRLRYSIETAGEEHPEDQSSAKAQDQGIPPEIRDALLTAYYAEHDKPKGET